MKTSADQLNVLVLKGGTSSERAVSLRSAQAVVEALQVNNRYIITEYDTKDGFEGILDHAADVAIPVLHGMGGEDGTIQEFLEQHDLKYVGADAACSRICFDKVSFKQVVRDAGVRTPDWQIVTADQITAGEGLPLPYVLKPIDGGSSVDTFLIHTEGDKVGVSDVVLQSHPKWLQEELIIGTELTIGVLDGKALPVIEIIPPENERFDYENKYNGRTQELCPPKNVSEERQRKAQKIAERCDKLVACRHLSRVDIMLSQTGELYVLELNTIPGLTDQSLFPKAAAEAGMSMTQLMDRLIDLALS